MPMWSVYAVLSVICLGFLIPAIIKTQRPLRCLTTSGVQGICALGLLNALGGITGVSVGFSWLSLVTSALLGIPGVIGLVTVSTIFQL